MININTFSLHKAFDCDARVGTLESTDMNRDRDQMFRKTSLDILITARLQEHTRVRTSVKRSIIDAVYLCTDEPRKLYLGPDLWLELER